tara:strand:+ start:1099 stop:1518 length:420 start_codon:yes stop_codon:yes gene_type:complete
MENRGRPKEQEAIPWQKYTQEMLEIPSKPELGGRSVWHWDRSKFDRGPYKTEHWEEKGFRQPKVKPEKGKAYGKQPVVLVFKTSNRSNAKTKIKVFKNENIDYILSANKLVGIPSTAEIIDIGVGISFEAKFTKKYNLA